MTRSVKKLAEEGLKAVIAEDIDLIGRFAAEDVLNMTTGEIYVEAGEEITEDLISNFVKTILLRLDTSHRRKLWTAPQKYSCR